MRLPFLRKAPADPRVVEAEQAYREAVAVATKQLKEARVPVVEEASKQKVAAPVSLGPLEKVVVFDRGENGVIWLAQLPRRVLMEHIDIKARRLKEMSKGRNAFLFGLLGLCFGVPVGIIFGFTAILSGLVIISTLATLLIALVLGTLAGIIPLAIVGYRRQGYAMWFVRREGQTVNPIEHSTFDQSRFQGHVMVKKDESGNVQVIVPPGVKAQSAAFVYHACRSSDWKGLWKGGQSKWGKLNTIFFGITALAALGVLFIVGYSSLQDKGGGAPPPPSAPPAEATPVPEVRPGEATVGGRG